MRLRTLLLVTAMALGGGFSTSGCQYLSRSAEDEIVRVVQGAGSKIFEETKGQAADQISKLGDAARQKIASAADSKAESAKAQYEKTGSAEDYLKWQLLAQLALLVGGGAGALHLGSKQSDVTNKLSDLAESHAAIAEAMKKT